MITLITLFGLLLRNRHKKNQVTDKEHQEWLERHDKYDERREFIHEAHREEDCGE